MNTNFGYVMPKCINRLIYYHKFHFTRFHDLFESDFLTLDSRIPVCFVFKVS